MRGEFKGQLDNIEDQVNDRVRLSNSRVLARLDEEEELSLWIVWSLGGQRTSFVWCENHQNRSTSDRREARWERDLMVDGNALVGVLNEVFVPEMTAARVKCEGVRRGLASPIASIDFDDVVDHYDKIIRKLDGPSDHDGSLVRRCFTQICSTMD